MKSQRILITIIFSTLLVSSCVPAKKFGNLEDASRQNVNERDSYKSDNIQLSMANRELEARLAGIDKDITEIQSNLTAMQAERDQAQQEFNRLNVRYKELQNSQEDLVKGNVRETTRLLAELQTAQGNLQQKENILRDLEANLDQKKTALDELTYELEKRNQRLMELEKILDSQQAAVRDLKNKVSEALFGFENNGLTVTMKNGNVYVSLDEKLLFKTGSYEIDANGRTALKKLVTVLERNPDIQIMIEGHTDNVPYRPSGGQLKDNWDLSVKRATTVVRELTEGTKIDAKRLTAAGRSEYLPVDNRSTTDARTRNRRTEIILTPDLSELYKIIEKF
jgi:chemotaxis protein MotB